jgi:hypothetical protein
MTIDPRAAELLPAPSRCLSVVPTSPSRLTSVAGFIPGPQPTSPGNIARSTVSASWTRKNGAAISSVTAPYGRNDTDHGTQSAFFVEGSRHVDTNTIYGRFEALDVEAAALLQTDTVHRRSSRQRHGPGLRLHRRRRAQHPGVARLRRRDRRRRDGAHVEYAHVATNGGSQHGDADESPNAMNSVQREVNCERDMW